MPEKQKPRSWKETHTIVAAIALSLLISLWNAFANHDRHRLQQGLSDASEPFIAAATDGCDNTTGALNAVTRCMTVTKTRSS